MINYIKGKIHFISEVVEGKTKAGKDWVSLTIVLSVPAAANSFTFIALKAVNDRVHMVKEFNVGDKVFVGYKVSSREWNGKWYSDIELVGIQPDVEVAPASKAAPAGEHSPKGVMARAGKTPETFNPEEYDDLPFGDR